MIISTAAAHAFPSKFAASDSGQTNTRLKYMPEEEQKIVIEFLNEHVLEHPVDTVKELHSQLQDGILLCRQVYWSMNDLMLGEIMFNNAELC